MELKITLTGTLCEIGQLENEGGANGICIARDNGTFVTVKGLSEAEARQLTGLFLDQVSIAMGKPA